MWSQCSRTHFRYRVAASFVWCRHCHRIAQRNIRVARASFGCPDRYHHRAAVVPSGHDAPR